MSKRSKTTTKKIERKGARSKNANCLLFHQKNPLVNYFQKQYSNVPAKLSFLRKIGKFKIGLNLVEGPMEIMQIRAYSKRSYEKTEANL